LAPAFVCVANVSASDGGVAIAEGNARVLAARLADARFFWEQDLKIPLEEQAKKLDGIVFHEKLGTVADKVERMAKLARWLVEEGIVGTLSPAGRGQGEGALPSSKRAEAPHPNPLPAGEREQLADLAERAARLAKADLVTGMVGEFPELQGVIGGYLAEAQGEPKAIADAIRDHYGMPLEPVSVAVALADKLDTIVEFFRIDERPTGSKDPFALRRAAIQSVFMIMRGLRLDLKDLAPPPVIDFFIERWIAQNRAAGGRPDLIQAVDAVTSDGDLVRMGERMRALEEFIVTEDGLNLLTAYKRAANILKKEGWVGPQVMSSADEQGIPQTGEEDPLVLVDDPILRDAIAEMASGEAGADLPEEKALIAALDKAERKAEAAVEKEDFTGAMAALASLRKPIDEFFDHVTVNDPDSAKRERRLNLLLRFRDAVNRVADFSKIEG
jgi:glycyl-tRNA synthetase beta chain